MRLGSLLPLVRAGSLDRAENLLAPKKKSKPKTNEDYYGEPFDTVTKRDRKQKQGSDVGKVYPTVKAKRKKKRKKKDPSDDEHR